MIRIARHMVNIKWADNNGDGGIMSAYDIIDW